ncbi:MAG: hypothetical protein AABX53_00710 [Nanoarchaeota archaeon]
MSLKENLLMGATYIAAGVAGIARGIYAQTGHISDTEANVLIDAALIISGTYIGSKVMTQEPLRLTKPRDELPGTSFDGLMVLLDGGIVLGKRAAGVGIGVAGTLIAERMGYLAGRGLAYVAAR